MTSLRTHRYSVAHSLGADRVVEINLNEAGPSDGRVVVFLHGSGPGASGASNFRENIDAFVEAGYRVILPDLIGYGASSKPEGIDYTLDLFVETLRDALRQHGIDRAALVGNSLGGGIAIKLALDEPGFASSLVLMAPGCVADQASYFTMPGIAKMKSDFGSSDFSLEQQRALIENLLHPSRKDCVTDALVRERYEVARTQPKDVLARMKTPNLGPRLGELAQPVFVMWGQDDEFCPASHAEMFLERCADARVLVFTNTGHWVQVERAFEFNRYAIGFLDAQG